MLRSKIDTDVYKLTMMAAVLSLYPMVEVTYELIIRKRVKFNKLAYDAIGDDVQKMASLSVSEQQIDYLQRTLPFLPPWYWNVLNAYQFDPREVHMELSSEGDLELTIKGLWWRTILREVPLMAVIVENYFKFVDTHWSNDRQLEILAEKARILHEGGCKIAEFGTRRRRDDLAQERAINVLRQHSNFVGTSNAHFACELGVKPLGTMAHEWIMAHQKLGGIRHCNRDALTAWQKVYGTALGIALTDTVGSKAFFDDLSDPAEGGLLARTFDGLRHDSGPWQTFVDNAVLFYQKLGIDPLSKTIIFSDGLDAQTAVEICKYCTSKIKCSFGIGTSLTNDFPGSPALNVVIKLRTVDGIPVVKISDTPTKAIGDLDALRVTGWIINGTPLDADVWRRSTR